MRLSVAGQVNTGAARLNFRTILREPLLHFLALGAGLFLLYGQVSPGDREGKTITIGQLQVDGIITQYQAQWNRPPTSAELRALVETQVRDEIFYREGKAMGLEQDDAVIKRRVRQKFDLIAEEDGAVVPTEAQLEAYRTAHPAIFTPPAVVTFDQLFFDPAKTDPASVVALRQALAAGATAVGKGERSLLAAHVEATPLNLVARDFGTQFAASVGTAPIDKWVGPVASGYGAHLVRVSVRAAPVLPPLNQIRDVAEREWANDQRITATAARLAALRAEYDVVIDARQFATK